MWEAINETIVHNGNALCDYRRADLDVSCQHWNLDKFDFRQRK